MDEAKGDDCLNAEDNDIVSDNDFSNDDDSIISGEEHGTQDDELDVTRNKDGSVLKRVLKKGTGVHNPVAGSEATISFYRQSTPDAITKLTYRVGNPGSEVPFGLDLALRHMNADEHSQITITRDESLGATLEPPVIFEMTLHSFEKMKHLSGISPFSEQIAYAKTLKNKANDFLKNDLYDSAIELYGKLEDDFQYVIANGPTEQAEHNENIMAVRLNLALAHLKMGNSAQCISFCEKILDVFADNEKALFRIGQAHLLRKDHEVASVYFEKIVKKNPKNTAAVNQLRMCTAIINKVKEQQRRTCRNLFNRYKDVGLGDNCHVTEAIPVEEKMTA